MWFAIGHIKAHLDLVIPAALALASGQPHPLYLDWSVCKPPLISKPAFVMPRGLPSFLEKQITVPMADQFSEFAALAYVARQAGMSFAHTGPNYALLDTKVPFGKPVPVYEFLWRVGHSYVPHLLNIYSGGRTIVVHNLNPSAV